MQDREHDVDRRERLTGLLVVESDDGTRTGRVRGEGESLAARVHVGMDRSRIARSAGSVEPSTHAPSVVMPIGTTS